MDRDLTSMFIAWMVRNNHPMGENLIKLKICSLAFQAEWIKFMAMPNFEITKNKFLESVKL